MKKILILLIIVLSLTACGESSVASHNLSEDADAFRILRRVTYFNTMTGDVLFVVEGNISVEVNPNSRKLDIIAKTGDNSYQKHYLGLSETTTYVVEQLEWKEEEKYRFKIVFNPALPKLELDND